MSFVLFTSLTNVLQFIGIILASTLMSTISQIIYKKYSDQNKIRELNNDIKELRSRMKGLKDQEELMKLNNKMLKLNGDKMRLIMKPMMYSSIIFIAGFYFWGKLFKGFNLFIFSNSYPIIGSDVGWLLTYAIASIFTTTIVRKKMGVQL